VLEGPVGTLEPPVERVGGAACMETIRVAPATAGCNGSAVASAETRTALVCVRAAGCAGAAGVEGVSRRAYQPLRLEFVASATIWPLSLMASALHRVQPVPLGIRLFRSLRV
jgi:hypothetical protein